MSSIDYTWNLEPRLREIVCSAELKSEILKYIEANNKSKGKAMSYSNIRYRCNLHYIEDNINKPTILAELQKVNNELLFDKNILNNEKKGI